MGEISFAVPSNYGSFVKTSSYLRRLFRVRYQVGFVVPVTVQPFLLPLALLPLLLPRLFPLLLEQEEVAQASVLRRPVRVG